MTNYHCDWFQVTEPLISPFNEFMRHLFSVWAIPVVHGKGYNGYRDRNEWGATVVEMWTDGDERMGRNWRFSGSSWDKLGAQIGEDVSWRYFVRTWAKTGKGNISRIDLASDFHDTDARDVSADIQHAMKERIIRNRKWREWNNSDLGYTAYFGAGKSDVMLRVYDKGAELDLEPFKICRTEFEVKGRKGQSIGDGLRTLPVLADDNDFNVGLWLERVTFGLMLEFIPAATLSRLGVDKWGVQPITLGSWLPRITNNDAWFNNVVVPALVNRLKKADGTIDEVFWSQFFSRLQQLLGIEGLDL